MTNHQCLIDRERLVSIESDVKHLVQSFDEFRKDVKARDGVMQKWLAERDANLDKRYVSRHEFFVVRLLVIGAATTVLFAWLEKLV